MAALDEADGRRGRRLRTDGSSGARCKGGAEAMKRQALDVITRLVEHGADLAQGKVRAWRRGEERRGEGGGVAWVGSCL